jgi:leucyl aminopeptidase
MMRMFAVSLAVAFLGMSSFAAAREVRFAETPATGGVLVVPLAAEADIETRATALDAAARTALRAALRDTDFKYKQHATLTMRGIGDRSEVIVVATGEGTLDAGDLQGIGGAATRAVKARGPVSILAGGFAEAGAAGHIATGAALGAYGFGKYKSGGDARLPEPVVVVTPAAAAAAAAFDRDGKPLVDAVQFARDLITEPANVVYPESFVERTRAAFAGVDGVRIEVLDVPAMQRLGMGGMLSVGQGSARPPRLLVVEYKGAGSPARPVVLAGKGITFDSGGISLKQGAGVWQMKYDMSGAAAATGAVLSLARSRAPVNVVAVAALAENLPSGTAARPGDVVRTYSGRTIEVVSTDAEGRVVLADAIAYAERKYQPAALVDIATLTGAIRTALGDDYAGLFTRDEALAAALLAAGEPTNENLWRMPLHPSYEDDTRSEIADIRNSTEGLNPGAGHGAHFIGSFLQPATRWAHLDIAGMAWAGEDRPAVPKGAAAFGVRLLDHFVRNFRP